MIKRMKGHLLFGICFFLLKLVIYSGLKKLKSIISCNSKIVLKYRVKVMVLNATYNSKIFLLYRGG
jgi:hypothetical protein